MKKASSTVQGAKWALLQREGFSVKVDIYNRLMAMQASRRKVLKGAATAGAVAAFSATGVLGKVSGALAQSDVRTQILQIPGVGKGSPTDADWQKVG